MRRFWTPEIWIVAGGAVLISVSVDYGLGVSFSHFWWGLMFWFGVGVVLGWVKYG
jgi:hypothetical protein